MPLFDYVCETCHRIVERFVTSEDAEKQQCCVCGGVMMKRPARVSFSVKGFNAANGYSLGGKNA